MTEQEITDRLADEDRREQELAAGLMAQAARGMGYYTELMVREGPPRPTTPTTTTHVLRYDFDSGENVVILYTGRVVSESDYESYHSRQRYGD